MSTATVQPYPVLIVFFEALNAAFCQPEMWLLRQKSKYFTAQGRCQERQWIVPALQRITHLKNDRFF